MTAVLINGPAIEPVSLVETKEHIRVDVGDEDGLISSLIAAARLHVETHIKRVLITQTWSVYLDSWPDNNLLKLPISPVQSVHSINVYDVANNLTVLDPDQYTVDTSSVPPRVLWHGSGAVPRSGRALHGIELVVTAGYGNTSADVPQPIRQAILMLVALWFEHREPPTLSAYDGVLPQAIAMLLQPYLLVRL